MRARTLKHPRLMLGAVLGAVSGMLLMTSASANDRSGSAATDPATIVASDGSIVPLAELARTGEISLPFEGTGTVSSAGNNAPPVPESTAPLTGETVIGLDKRIAITATTSFPYRAIGLITMTVGGNTATCTGWLINKNTVVTAGHCVNAGGTGGVPGAAATNVRFQAGRSGASTPYGTCRGRKTFTTAGWRNNSDERYDYGAIKLDCTVGNTTGFFGYTSTSSGLVNVPNEVAGYPGDKPNGTMWLARDCAGTRFSFLQCVVKAGTADSIFYPNDTFGGMSGSPVFYRFGPCYPCGMAIHTTGLHGSGPHSTFNHGTRINPTVFSFLNTVKNMP